MSSQVHKGSIRFKDMQITFEGPSDFVEAMVEKFASADEWVGTAETGLALRQAPTSGKQSLSNLVAQKKPRGHHEIIAVLAFGLTAGGMPVFNEEDVHRAYLEAGVRPPKVVSQALRDAKNKYQFVQLAGKRGRYRITNHGDRVVRFDLPRAGGEN